MAMGSVGALDLAAEVGQRHDLLGARRQVSQTDLSVGQLVADDDREMRLVPGSGFELSAELAATELRPIPAARRSVATASRAAVASGSAPTTTATGAGSGATPTPVSVRARSSLSSPIPNPMPGVGRPPNSSMRPS